MRQIVPVVATTMSRSTRGEMTTPRLNARQVALGIFAAIEAFAFVFYMLLGRFAWWKVISENRQTIFKLAKQGVEAWWESRTRPAPAPATSAGD